MGTSSPTALPPGEDLDQGIGVHDIDGHELDNTYAVNKPKYIIM